MPNHDRGNAISPWIARFAPLVREGGRVLDVAAGGGRHSRFFAARGHLVCAVDIEVSGLADLTGDPRIEVVSADLEGGGPWPFVARTFDCVLVTNYLHRPLLPLLCDAVGPGGILLYETFAQGNERFGRPKNPDFLLRPGELLETVAGRLQVIAYEHGLMEEPRASVRQRICAIRSTVPAPLA